MSNDIGTAEGLFPATFLTVDDRVTEARKSAILSPDGHYRYSLSRHWDAGREPMTFVMLNPSTADADVDDPTIRRCIGFAKRQGFGSLHVLNLYALRATNPKELWKSHDPVGPDNDEILRSQLSLRADHGRPVVVAWGANAKPARVAQLRELATGIELLCLGTTAAGQPRHPLYIRGDQPFEVWGA